MKEGRRLAAHSLVCGKWAARRRPSLRLPTLVGQIDAGDLCVEARHRGVVVLAHAGGGGRQEHLQGGRGERGGGGWGGCGGGGDRGRGGGGGGRAGLWPWGRGGRRGAGWACLPGGGPPRR